MSWMARLYETYEQGVKLDLPGEKLLPVGHTLQNAHINIALDGEGNFLYARVLEKATIIMPATEQSAGRTSGEAAHALADKLQYVAMDYAKYGGQKNSYFSSYQAQLKGWCDSEYTCPKVVAVFRYISKGSVIEDLINARIVHIDENQKLLSNWPHEINEDKPLPLLFKVLPSAGFDQGSALVCWSVQLPGDPIQNTWEDGSVQQSWISYCSLGFAEEGFCYITGEQQLLAASHPAKLRHTGDKAKLISSNDSSGFTYRGRFLDDMQASSVGSDVTQKAHNALRWLIARQGCRHGDQVIVAWAVSGKSIPDPLIDTHQLFPDIDDESLTQNITIPTTLDYGSDLGQYYAFKLNKKIAGYRAELGDIEQIIIMGIDSATPGRMGVVYYRECMAKEFLNRLESWHLDFSWQQRYTKQVTQIEGKKSKPRTIWSVSTPSPKAIAEAMYGKTLTESLRKNLFERLLPCIIEQRPLPLDILNFVIQRACNPLNVEHWEWERNLGVACALYRGFYKRQPSQMKRRDYSMSLEKENKSRDYLYGRLLAVAEYIEQIALNVSHENRLTSAERLMHQFAMRPFSTWQNIELALQPYTQRLQTSRRGFLINQQKELDDIMSLFQSSEFVSDKKLKGEFLLAYHCQRQNLRNKPEPESV